MHDPLTVAGRSSFRRLTRFSWALVLLAMALAVAGLSPALAQQAKQPWSPSTSVAMRYYAASMQDALDVGYVTDSASPARFSPDGRYFFAISWQGDLPRDQNEFTLSVYSTQSVRDALGAGRTEPSLPLRSVVMRSGYADHPRAAAINDAKWADERTISFLGVSGRERIKPFAFDVESGALVPLLQGDVSLTGDVEAFVVRGDTVVFQVPEQADVSEWRRFPYSVLTPEALDASRVINGQTDRVAYYASVDGGPPKRLFSAHLRGKSGPWISPDERYALTVYAPSDSTSPPEWGQYKFPLGFVGTRLMLIDLQTGMVVPVGRAPAGPGVVNFFQGSEQSVPEFWPIFMTGDSRQALVVNATRPLDPKHPEYATKSWIGAVDLHNGVFTPIDEMPIGQVKAEARWIEPGRSVLIRIPQQDGTFARLYEYAGGRWRSRAVSKEFAADMAAPRSSAVDFEIAIRESANDPQRLVARRGESMIFLDQPDPVIENTVRSSVETIHFTDSAGRKAEALLMLPPGHRDGDKHPLVVQLADSRNPPTAFRPDGSVGTGYAAQALAAQGFAVLQLEDAIFLPDRSKADWGLVLTPDEGIAQVERIDSAVDLLRERGVVDDRPIGLIGFSRSGYHTYYIATHPGRTRVGAAVVFDSISYGFGQYTSYAATEPGSTLHYGLQYGPGDNRTFTKALSFWANKSSWMDAPSFNLDKLSTAMLFTYSRAPEAAMETAGAFQIARRPFEGIFFPEAPHYLVSPRQRFAAMQATVDWMNFWLQDRQPQATDDPDRGSRWQGIRSRWVRQQAWERAGNPVGSIPGE